MKITIIAFTRNGGAAAKRLSDKLGAEGYLFERYSAEGLAPFVSLSELVRDKYNKSDALVFIGACGIAIRAIAPYIKSKKTDPAVIVMDERERYAIPVLSGHIGGANALAEKIASITGAEPVITTATDINDVFSVDVFAVKNNLYIDDMDMAKLISAEVLEGHKIGLYSDFELDGVPDCFCENSDIGICISHDGGKKPFKKTLNLIPRNAVMGIGCKKGTSDVTRFAKELLSANGISPEAVRAVTSIDLKKDEPAITRLCDELGAELKTYSAAELMAQKGNFTPSDFVMRSVGADNVCERSVAAFGAEVTVKKTAKDGVTLAIGTLKMKIDFKEGQ